VRADRLIAIVLLLQTHGQLTAAQLAERLETSERTIRRDLDALSGAGVPVYAQRGRGGGWALLNGHRLDVSGLTAGEARALFLVAGPNALAGLGDEPRVRSALRKLLAALPESVRDEAEAANSAMLVDPSRWGKTAEQAPRHLDTLQDAVVRGVQIEISYAKPGQAPAPRVVHPFGLVAKNGVWYLLAGAEAGLRTFRVSRVRAVLVTEDPVVRPDDFDLATAWEDVQRNLPKRMGTVPVDLRVDPKLVGRIHALLGGWVALEPLEVSDPDGWARFRASFPHERVAAAELARFADAVEVLSPEPVRAELARIGRELSARYAD
jgi:predicted DNA-binding transcriptional regulator YafY